MLGHLHDTWSTDDKGVRGEWTYGYSRCEYMRGKSQRWLRGLGLEQESRKMELPIKEMRRIKNKQV